MTRIVAEVARRTWQKTFRRPVALTFSFLQPLLWLLLFGFLFRRYPLEASLAGYSYLDFLLPGVCGMTVLFGASQSGIELIRDSQTGFLGRMLGTPAGRGALFLGKVLADVARLLLQAALLFLLGVALGARAAPSPGSLAGALLALALLGISLSSLSCTIALKAKAPETMAAFVHLVNWPLLFTSTALLPERQMPPLLAEASRWNPLTLAVDAVRGAVLFARPASFATQLLPLFLLAAALFGIGVAALSRAARESG